MNNFKNKHKRISLPNGCSISAPSIHPYNWNQQGASVQFDWYIQYRFYDPSIKSGDKHSRGKQCIIKGMNEFKNISDRRRIIKDLLANEMSLLQARGYNPITNIFSIQMQEPAILEKSGLLKSLYNVFEKLRCDNSTRGDIKSVLKYASIAIKQLGFEFLSLSEVTKKHIRFILDQCAENQNYRARENPEKLKKNPAFWNADRHNKYRAYLMILFNELCELELIDINPVRGLQKMKITKKLRRVLTYEEIAIISKTLEKSNYRFWIFLNIFYPSGSREVELIRLQGKDVDLEKQTFTRLVKKGKIFEEVKTTITDSALPFWIIALQECKPFDYVFSVGLIPGKKMIRKEQITRRWYRSVKKKLGISADCYSLKHLFTSGVVDILNDEDAAKHNAHKSTSMVNNVYDYRREKRLHEKMKTIPLRFNQS